jgi:hypothetical protein
VPVAVALWQPEAARERAVLFKTGLCACADTVASCHHGQIASDQPQPGATPAAAPGPGPGAMTHRARPSLSPGPTPPTGRFGNFGPPGALTRPKAASEASIIWPSASASGINLSGCSVQDNASGRSALRSIQTFGKDDRQCHGWAPRCQERCQETRIISQRVVCHSGKNRRL